MDVYWYNLDLNHNGVIDENDAEFLEAAAKLRGPSSYNAKRRHYTRCKSYNGLNADI